MKSIISEFDAEVVVGLCNSVALIKLVESQITPSGAKIVNGSNFAVKNDITADTPADWFFHLTPKGAGYEVGIYRIKGKVRFDEDSAVYSGVEIHRVGTSESLIQT